MINKDRTIDITCPNCQGTKAGVPISVFRDLQGEKTVRCTCGETFLVRLDGRNMFRKEINIRGAYTNLTKNLPQAPMLVTNISLQGIGFTANRDHRIETGDELQALFILDDDRCTQIFRKVTVISVRNKKIGCEFVDADRYDPKLSYYLLS